jgi:NAD(P)H-binding
VARHADQLVIKLPEQGVLIAQDLIYHATHLFLGNNDITGWTKAVDALAAEPSYDTVLARHGRKHLMSRIVVFGAAGKAGSRVVTEAAARGHQVTAVARTLDRLRDLPDGVRAVAGDVTDPPRVTCKP